MAARRQPTTLDDAGTATAPVNDVHVRGRLAAPADQRTLPSGDSVVTFRLVVDRPARTSPRASAARVDTLDCAVFGAGIRKRALAWGPGDVLELRGSLRRRFFRTGGGPASRYEIEIVSASRVARAA